MIKPKLLYLFDNEYRDFPDRKPYSAPYLLGEALKEFFYVYFFGEIEPLQADLIFNTEPINRFKDFLSGKKTFYWEQAPIEHVRTEHFQYCDWIFYNSPSFKGDFTANSELFLDAAIPDYKYYPSEFEYDIGFLGQEFVTPRRELLNKIGERYKLLRGSVSLGKESAELLSKAKLLLIYDDYKERHPWIERRIYTFGNIRPVLVHWNDDYLIFGPKDKYFIPWEGEKQLFEKIDYYLHHMEEAEKIGNAWKTEIAKKHQYKNRAKQIYERFLKI